MPHDLQMHSELERHSKFRDSAELRVQSAENIAAHLSEQFSLLAREGRHKSILHCSQPSPSSYQLQNACFDTAAPASRGRKEHHERRAFNLDVSQTAGRNESRQTRRRCNGR